MRRGYLYNIAYFHSNGQAVSQVVRKTKINSFEELMALKEYLEEINKVKNVAITNFQLVCRCPMNKYPECT